MDNHVTCEQTARRFEENNLDFDTLVLNDGMKIILSQSGGRILGPFDGDDGESILWMNEAFKKKNKFREFLSSDQWNLGGDRVWIAPELQFNVRDRQDFFGSYIVPRQVDPGNYTIKKVSDQKCVLAQDMTLDVYGGDKKRTKELSVERIVNSSEDPLRELDDHKELLKDVRYCGYEHRIKLREKSSDGTYSEAWDLAQVNPGGALYIPTFSTPRYSDYYQPLGDEYQEMHSGYAKLKIDGVRQFKVGFKAIQVQGRLGYHKSCEDGRDYLLIWQFFSNPSATYTKEPADKPGCKGHSLHIYNDDNTFGGFAEVECSGQALGGNTGMSESDDQMLTWLYIGAPDRIATIARSTLGLNISR
jgi:hypothetical protein